MDRQLGKRHLNDSRTMRYKIPWSDEITIELFGLNAKHDIWRKPCTIPTVKRGGVFQRQGLGNQSELKERWMEQSTERSLKKTCSRAFRTSDEGSHSNRTTTLRTQPRQCRSGFGDKSLNVLEWPNQSLDLNPIHNHWRPENSWAAMLPIQPDSALRGSAVKNGRNSPNTGVIILYRHTQEDEESLLKVLQKSTE